MPKLSELQQAINQLTAQIEHLTSARQLLINIQRSKPSPARKPKAVQA